MEMDYRIQSPVLLDRPITGAQLLEVLPFCFKGAGVSRDPVMLSRGNQPDLESVTITILMPDDYDLAVGVGADASREVYLSFSYPSLYIRTPEHFQFGTSSQNDCYVEKCTRAAQQLQDYLLKLQQKKEQKKRQEQGE